MTSNISFGNIQLDGYTARLFGTSSGIDTDQLIQGLVEAKRLPAVRLETKITENEARLAAFEELRGLLSDLRSAVAGLRNPPGYFGIDDNLFETKDVFFSSDTTTSPAELLAVSASNRAQAGTFDLVVERLATAHKLSSDSASASDQLLKDAFNGGATFSGTFSIGLAGGTTADVTVDGDMDIYDLRDAINAVSADTKVSASVLKVSDTDYRLVLSAQETGKDIQFTAVSGDPVTDIVGFTTSGGTAIKNELQSAQTARIQLDGVVIERDSNVIDDALEGITLNLFKADSATTVTVSVERSAASVKQAISDFVDAYNAFRDFVEIHRQIDDAGEVAEDAVLFGDRTLREIESAVSSIVTGSVDGLAAGEPDALSDIGITMDESNRLVIDESKLDAALVSDLDGVRKVFEFTFSASSPELSAYTRTNALSDTSFTVDIVDADGDGVIESATIDGIAADVSGGSITGVAGTPYEGLTMIWTGSGSTSIQVDVSQGLADRLYNALDSALDELDGSLTQRIDDLEAENARYEEEIARIDQRVETFRQSLITKFAALEEQLALLDTMLTQVRSAAEAMFSSDK